MKTFIFAVIFSALFSTTFAQIVNEDFESYTTGNGVAEEAGSPWSTWSNQPGGSEDPVISETMAHNGIKSAYVSGSNDGILNLNDLTTGRYRLDFYINVESGKSGYFNILQDFNGGNSKWGVDMFFNPDQTGSISAGGADAATFSYTQGSWMHIRFFIDLDNDFATAILDGNELVSWKWSTGSSGGNSLNKLDAVDFFAWAPTGGTPGYYFDDVTFTQLSTLNAPQNLASSLTDDDVSLSWDAPSGNTPDSYVISRNDKIIASGISGLSYDDMNIYPGDYTYSVKAFYNDEGYSPSSNETSETISGGIDRDLVLYEIGTGTWCQYCPGAAMGADDMISNGHNAAIIEYHSGDDYQNTFSTARISYYTINAFPTTLADGTNRFEGGSHTESLYPTFLNFYNERINRKSLYSLNMTISHVDGNNYHADIDVTEEYQYFTGTVKLRVAVTESGIPKSWQGLSELNFVCIDMLPNADGTTLDFTGNSTQTISLDFTVDESSHVINNCEIIAFVQDEDSKEVVNTVKFDMGDLFASVNDIYDNTASVYPNPVSSYLNIKNSDNFALNIYDISGKLIFSDNNLTNEKNINTVKFDNGIYFAKLISGNKIITKKFTVKK